MSEAQGEFGRALAKDVEHRVTGILNNFQSNADKKLESYDEQARLALKEWDRDIRDRLDALRETSKDFSRVSQERLDHIENTVTRDMRRSIFSVVLSAVVAAATLMAAGAFLVLKDVNNSVIQLQNTVLASQATIQSATREADKAVKEAETKVVEQSVRLTSASNTLSAKQQELENVAARMRDITAQAASLLTAKQQELDAVKAELRSATTQMAKMADQLEGAKAEYARMNTKIP